MFGKPLQLSYPHGGTEQRSIIGSCLSLLVIFICLAFSLQNLLVMYERGATQFSYTEKKGNLPEDFSFSPDDGFRVGALLSGLSTEAEELLDSISIKATM
mmetsp:Transcript_15910/g.20081  ORF Transcript_15910/g.20081 Transcript_15910/m.20081 type:complete len:100 (+) Transcript_15910:82-381(+)